ncbi:MAG: hypothetical protein ABFC31_09820 [Clostridiaceae bacterium]
MNQTHNQLKKAITLLALFMLAAVFLAGCSASLTIAGVDVDRKAETLDLSNRDISDAGSVKSLKKLHSLRTLDLRGNPLDTEDFDALSAMLPECAILWSVPIGGDRFDSDSTAVTAPGFSAADVEALAYFTNLSALDATGSTDYAALIEAQKAYPNIAFTWTVQAAGKTFESGAESILCPAEAGLAEAETLLSALPNLKSIDLLNTELMAEDVETLMGQYPGVQFHVNKLLLGQKVDYLAEEAALAGTGTLDVPALTEALAGFPALATLDVRTFDATEADIAAINASFPALHVRRNITLLEGFAADSDSETLDLRGYTVSDLAAFQERLKLFTKLTYIDMCECGPTDEEMDALRQAMPGIKFVWMLHIGKWDVRTDVKAFSMAQTGEYEGVVYTKPDDKKRRYRYVTNEEIAKIRYCTDIEALDIGHSLVISDISFVKYVPTLRFLVIARTSVTDISAVSALKNLIFFETFGCKLTDVSALYDLPQLEYYNCSANRITDIGPLLSLKNLKRLWIINCRFTDEQLQELKVGLPDTIIMAYGKHQTDNGWRYDNDAYLEMQELFGLIPQLAFVEPGYLDPKNQIP